MNTTEFEAKLRRQRFPNGYELVDGVAMQQANGAQFQIPHPVLKKHILPGHFVELRIDSTRFSVHQDSAVKCTCPSCNGELSKPILRHEHPATLLPLAESQVPSRGWGEDFWVEVIDRNGPRFVGVVDNPLVESRLHELHQGDEIYFHQDHLLAVHHVHRQELLAGMSEADLKELAAWLGDQS